MPNKVDLQHKELIKKILEKGVDKRDRTGVGTKSIFGHQLVYDMEEGFPLLTLRKIHTKSVIHEMLWFLGAYDKDKYDQFGNTNIRYLLDHGVTFWSDWPYYSYLRSREYRPELPEMNIKEFEAKIIIDDAFAKEFGSIGPGYGKQWTNYGCGVDKKIEDGKQTLTITQGINQIDYLINELKKDPDSRRLILDAWKVDEIKEMLLPPCFTSGVKIFTSDGYKNIEDIKIGDLVYTHMGNFKKVNRVFKTPYKGDILNIRTRYGSHEFGCTPNHAFLVKDKGWVKAKDISEDDKLGIKINNKSIIPEISMKIGVNQYKDFKEDKVKLDNIDDWYIMGYFLGDGWINQLNSKKSQIFFAISEKQEDIILSKLKKRMSLYKDKRHVGMVHRFECKNKRWYNIFKEFGKFSHGKIIPEWVQDAPVEYIKEFLKGYFDSDGTLNKTTTVYMTTSENISFGIQRLFAKTKQVSRHYFQNRKEKAIILGREVNQKPTYQISVNKNPIKNRFTFDEDYLWVGINYIQESSMDDYVYNLSVDDDNSYTVNNICTHNCHFTFQLWTKRIKPEHKLHEFTKWLDMNKLPIKPIDNYPEFPERKLSMMLTIRSNDIGLGNPFNVAEYALLLHMMAQVVHMIPNKLIVNIGDAHIYNNHVEQLKKMIDRDGYNLPTLKLNKNIRNIYDFRIEDIIIENYNSHPNIKMDVAV